MDPQVTSIQPGGGFCMRLELAWGHVRRWYLKTFCKRYLARMQATRQGTPTAACPHEVLDPRDVKFYRNQGGYFWHPRDDPFHWRDQLPFARVGLTELWFLSTFFFILAGVLGAIHWALSLFPTFCALCVIWFFRNPRRVPPTDPGLLVSPADGKVVHIEELAHDDFIGGKAVLIGIFLSVFNVHINRVPSSARIIGMTYRKGKFLNALNPASARENEQLAIRLEENVAPHRKLIVRQIAGLIARRIVCWVKPGDELARGEQFGMIKLGSRTELVLPWEPGLVITTKIGDHVQAGESVLAKYTESISPQ